MAFIQNLFTSRKNLSDTSTFVGNKDRIYYDSDTNSFKLGDGVTPGGIAIGGGGGGGGDYVLPTASTTVKGGVKVDGTTITISNQVISGFDGNYNSLTNRPTLFNGDYNSLTNRPTIPSNTNQLTNGAGFITSSALTGYATESFVTTRGYLTAVTWNDVTSKPSFATVATTGSYNDLTNRPTIPTNTNQLTNGAGFITTSALTGYATETFVTTRGYLTSVTWNDVTSKPSFATVATSGSYTDLLNKPVLFSGSYTDLTNKPTLFSGSYNDLTNKPTIPTDTNQLTNTAGFITSSALTGYATETFVTTRGYLTSVSWTDVQNKPSFATVATSGSYTDLINKPTLFSGSYTDLTNKPTLVTSYNQLTDLPSLFSGSYNDLTNKPTIPTDTNQLTNTAGFITSSALTGYATETFVGQSISDLVGGAPAILDTLNEIAASLNNDASAVNTLLTEINKKANLADMMITVSGDDSTERIIYINEGIRLQGAGTVSIVTDDEGKITITGAATDLTGYATETYVTSQGYITSAALPTNVSELTNDAQYATQAYVTEQLGNAGVIVSETAPNSELEGKLWFNSTDGSLYIKYDGFWIAVKSFLGLVDYNTLVNAPVLSSVATSGNYNDLTNKPDTVSLGVSVAMSVVL